MEPSMDRLTELARRLLRKGGRTIIGITGPPGAGKSTIAAAIVGAVGADARPEGCTGYLRHAGVHGIATETPRRHRGRRLCATIRARDRGSHSRAVAIERHVPLVVTEGNYLLVDDGAWAEVRHLLDACWYVDLPEKIRQRRLTARHDGYGRSAGEALGRTLGSDQVNTEVVEATRHRADLFITSGAD
jgi:pantothenate kinase